MSGPVQHASNTGTSSPVAVTLSATGSGNTLLVYVGTVASGAASPAVSGITLGASGDTFTQVVAENAESSGGYPDGEIWIDKNAASGETTVTVSFTGGSGSIAYIVAVEEWAGVYETVDKTNGGNGVSSSFSSGSTGTLSQSVELAVGMVAASPTAPTFTGPAGSWTNQATIPASSGSTDIGLRSGWQITAATTALTYSGTINTSDAYAGLIATFELSASTFFNPAVVKVAAGPVTPAGAVALGTAAVQVAAQPVTPGIPALIISITPNGVTDEFGNAAVAGVTVYEEASPGVWLATSLFGDGVAGYTATSEAGPWTLTGFLGITGGGYLALQFGGTTGAIPQPAPSVSGADGLAIVAALQAAGIFQP